MGSMKDLYTQGVTDLESYNIGYQDAEDRIIKLLDGLIDKRTTYETPTEYLVQKKLLEYAITLIKGEK